MSIQLIAAHLHGEQRLKKGPLVFKGQRVLLASLAVASLFVYRPSLSQQSAADIAAAEAGLRKADADWSAAVPPASVDAWMRFYATDAIVLLPNDRLASGQESVRNAVTRLLALPHLSIAWHPIKVNLAASGDLAYVTGEYELRRGEARAPPSSDRGRRVEIWRLHTDGTWKCIVDTWNSDEPAASPVQAAAPAAELRVSEPPRRKFGDGSAGAGASAGCEIR